MLDHGCGNHLGARCQLTLQADQLFFQQGQGFRYTDQHAVERPGRGFAGGYARHGIKGQAVAHQVLFQTLESQERITAADHPHLARQAGRQRAETVIEHQYPGVRRRLLFGQMIEQVFIGRIESLQRFILLFGLADQVEAGEGCFEQRHGAGLWVINGCPAARRRWSGRSRPSVMRREGLHAITQEGPQMVRFFCLDYSQVFPQPGAFRWLRTGPRQ
ncbi:hypothetical protein D9M71_196150 [compost metagenome]